MHLYIDETETDDFFIVVGLLMPSEEVMESSFKQFKNSIRNYHIPTKYKCKLYVEFKSTLMESAYWFVRKQLLKSVDKSAICVLYSFYKKPSKNFKQGSKEKQYIRLVKNIVSFLGTYKNINIIFDKFGIKNFDSLIVENLQCFDTVVSVIGKDSQACHGLQYVDNLCGVIRLMISKKDKHNSYSIIKNKIVFVDNSKNNV